MAELQAEVAYWLSVAIRAVQSFPSFIGNNWVGVLLSIILLLAAARQQIKNHFTTITSLPLSGKAPYAWQVLMKTNWRTVAAIMGLFYLGNFLTVGFKDYASASDQNKITTLRLADANGKLATSQVNCQLQTNDIRNERDSTKAKYETLEKQSRDQQTTINGCLSQAMKLLTPEAPRTVLLMDRIQPNPNSAKWSQELIVLTNRTVIGASGRIICDKAFNQIRLRIAGARAYMNTGASKVAANAADFSVGSPNWSPTAPLVFTIFHDDEGPGECRMALTTSK
jgi:hypothetical protein